MELVGMLFLGLFNLLLGGVTIFTAHSGPVRRLWVATGFAFLYGVTAGILFPPPGLVKALGYGLLSSLVIGFGSFWMRYQASGSSLEGFLKKLFAKK